MRIIAFAWTGLLFVAPVGQAQSVPTLSLTREIRIDGDAQDMVRVGWLRVAADGRIAFAQDQDKLVRFYDSAGKPPLPILSETISFA